MESKNGKFESELENALSSDELNALEAGQKSEILDGKVASKDGDGYALVCCSGRDEE
ncbi:MAG: hypothetical protein LBS42_10415 [Tannerella sp.]|nr:hypothetical protein [Tannerella sp.]